MTRRKCRLLPISGIAGPDTKGVFWITNSAGLLNVTPLVVPFTVDVTSWAMVSMPPLVVTVTGTPVAEKVPAVNSRTLERSASEADRVRRSGG